MDEPASAAIRRIFKVVAAVLLVAAVTFGTLLYKRTQSMTLAQIRNNALDIARITAELIDKEAFASLRVGDESTEAYRKVMDVLVQVRDSTDVEYVYTIRRNDEGLFVFVVDSDPDKPGVIGEVYAGTPVAAKALAGELAADDAPYTDRWGTHISAYAPLFLDGKPVGAAVVDLNYKSVQGKVRQVTFLAIALYAAAYLVGFLLLVHVGREMRQYEFRLREANRYKSDFLANMSHEIRTPINAVLGMNEMLLRETVQAMEKPPQTADAMQETFLKVRGYACDIRSAGQNLLSIVNDILDFSKIESGKMELSEREYRLGSVLNDVRNMIAFRARTRRLAFVMDVDETMPNAYIGDELRVRQILANVLTNAVKYTEKGSVTLTVREEKASPTAHGMTKEFDSKVKALSLLKFTVKDTGIGIREADRKKLFAKFERIDLKKNNTIEGTGLGLAITKSLLDMMHGTITVESEYGKGSTFTIVIPQQMTDDRPIGDFCRAFDAERDQEEAYRETFRAPDARILVVDDTALNLAVFKGLLANTQVKVNTASGGPQALEMARDIPFDLIFMDQRMPGMDGTQTLKAIRAQTEGVNCETPVVSLTADAVQGARERYISEGFVDYLSKPVNGLQLEAMLMKYLPKEKVEIIREKKTPSAQALAE